jgi:hypothetical protein
LAAQRGRKVRATLLEQHILETKREVVAAARLA